MILTCCICEHQFKLLEYDLDERMCINCLEKEEV
jgi:hypothetical protein